MGNDEADFSVAVRDAFRRRSKTLSRQGAMVECTPVKELVDGRESEQGRTDVTITYRVGEGGPVQLRVHAWGDGWVWVDVRRSSKAGWVWEYTSEGRFISPKGARGLVECVESTIGASFLAASEVPRAIAHVWFTSLAVGPRLV